MDDSLFLIGLLILIIACIIMVCCCGLFSRNSASQPASQPASQYSRFRFREGEPRYYPFKSPERLIWTPQRYQFGIQLQSLSVQSPWRLEPEEFGSWYDREIVGLYGLQHFKDECARVVDEVVQVMYRHMSLNVKEVVKGGSLGKGTMLRGDSDIDCVVIVNSLPYLKDVQDIGRYVETNLARTIDYMENAIQNHSTVVSKRRNRYMFTATLIVSGFEVEVDMIPTADNLVYEGTPEIYKSMLKRSSDEREFYSAGLVKLQVNFIKSKPGVVKELIRLVKYWNKHTVKSALRTLDQPLPNSYAMELITVYAWEKVGSPYRFNRLQGFKAVLTVIGEDLDTVYHFWTDNYSESVAYRGIAKIDDKWSSKKSPLILDPANPTNNVCGRYRKTWNAVSRVARETLSSNLLRRIRVGWCWE